MQVGYPINAADPICLYPNAQAARFFSLHSMALIVRGVPPYRQATQENAGEDGEEISHVHGHNRQHSVVR